MCCSTRLAHSLARPLARRQRVPFTSSWGTVIRSFPCSPSPLMKPWTEPGSGRSPSVPLDPSPACRLLVRCRGYVPFPLLLCGEILAGGGRISRSVLRPTSRRRVAVAIAFALAAGPSTAPFASAPRLAQTLDAGRVHGRGCICSGACRDPDSLLSTRLGERIGCMSVAGGSHCSPATLEVCDVLVGFRRGRGGGDCRFIIHRPAAARARSWRRLRRGDGCPAAVAPGH